MLLNCGVGEDSRLLRVPWTPRRSNQSILKEISSGCSLEGLMLKLKLQYFGYHVKSQLIGKDSDAGRNWEQEEKGRTENEMVGWHHWLDGHEFGWTLGVGNIGRPGVLQFMGWQRFGHNWATELNWTEPLPKRAHGPPAIATGLKPCPLGTSTLHTTPQRFLSFP